MKRHTTSVHSRKKLTASESPASLSIAAAPLPNAPTSRREHFMALGLLALLVLAMFGDLLFTGGSRAFGNKGTDLYLQFVSWREFGFGELLKGNLALWNPYIYAGAPYFGGAQAALLYPINFLSLIFPVVASLNWSIALNAFLFGALTYAWMIFRGLKPASGLFAAVLAVFSGAHFMHVYSGHTVHMATMAWGPLILMAVDGVFERRKLTWALVGMGAVAMQVFAGHPQYLFYTAIAAGLYSCCRMVGTKLSVGLLAGLAAIYVGGILLSAIQLFAAVQASGETIRSNPLPYSFAAMFSLPPENLITLIAPNFFGDMMHQSYWGRCYLWEMSLYIGVVGLVLAIYGAFSERRGTRVAAVMVGLLLLLALGDHTPLFSFLYHHVPGFDKFRCMAKFTYPATLFMSLLAAQGFDRIWVKREVSPLVLRLVFGMAGGLLLFGVWVQMADWQSVLQGVMETRESYLPAQFFKSAEYAKGAQHFASATVFIAAGTALLLGLLLVGLKRNRNLVYAVLGLLVLEMFVVAWNSRDTFDTNIIVMPGEKKFLDAHPGDYRIINPVNSNSGMSIGAQDMWGSDPGVVRRYAEFATWTQGGDPDQATQYVQFAKFDPLYAMLRLKYVFVPDQNQLRIAEAPTAPLPRMLLVSKYRVLKKRDAIFAAMREPFFDPRKEVLLESSPTPAPVESGEPGTVKLLGSSTDEMTLEADLAQPAVLLITDLYTPGWKAVPLPGSSQEHYELVPANYILRAIPLAAGHHHLKVEYAPVEYRIGKWISVVAWIAFVGAAAGAVRRKKGKV